MAFMISRKRGNEKLFGVERRPIKEATGCDGPRIGARKLASFPPISRLDQLKRVNGQFNRPSDPRSGRSIFREDRERFLPAGESIENEGRDARSAPTRLTTRDVDARRGKVH